MADPTPKSRRRWFQFGLGTMLLLVTLLCMWLAWQANWIKQRHGYWAEHPYSSREPELNDKLATAPRLLWLLGEPGETRMQVNVPTFSKNGEYHRKNAGPEAERARALFPEAIIEVIERDYSEETGIVWHTWKPGTTWDWGKR